jgi:hypothetical protein
VIVEHDRVEVFDPVEFDPALREIDVSADLAFLMMDLIDAGPEELAEALVDEYKSAGPRRETAAQLLRRIPRVGAWQGCVPEGRRAGAGGRPGGAAGQARRLAAVARRLAWRARRPMVIVVCGAAATGKTHLAEAICVLSGMPHLNSDRVRRQLAGLALQERAREREYSEEASLNTYRELGVRAAARATSGAVVDATFRGRSHRAASAEASAGRRCSSNAGRPPPWWRSGRRSASGTRAASPTPHRRSRPRSSRSSAARRGAARATPRAAH